MSGGQGSGSGTPQRHDEPKVFTLAAARRTLPLVRRIVSDIVEGYPAVQEKLGRFQRSVAAAAPGDDPAPLEALRDEINRDADRINGFVEELQDIGCLFKGFGEGLVDWYAVYRERGIFLCWKHGEEDILWWHEIETGFAGRRPITEDMEADL